MRIGLLASVLLAASLLACSPKGDTADAGPLSVQLTPQNLSTIASLIEARGPGPIMGAASGGVNVNNQTMLTEFVYDVPDGGVIGYTDASTADGAVVDGGSYWACPANKVCKSFVLSGGTCTTTGNCTIAVNMFGINGNNGAQGVTLPPLSCGVGQPYVTTAILNPGTACTVTPSQE